jgi:hypothetical protein
MCNKQQDVFTFLGMLRPVCCACRSGRAACKGPKAVCEVVSLDRKIEKGEWHDRVLRFRSGLEWCDFAWSAVHSQRMDCVVLVTPQRGSILLC